MTEPRGALTVIAVGSTDARATLKLGRYEIVKHLAQGGMADVLLARTVGIEGFERHVVIKRIRAEQARDRRYVDMFLDEARLAATLHHHNIVPVNDIGEEAGEYFFAMEYVHGEDVRALLAQLSKCKQHIPLEHAITIITAAAAGLHHAHEQRGPDRAPLDIVHRDVSPANILLGYDGGVKVADFGIAKAAHRATETRSGTLKGKVAYMSPEQCVGEAVDRRSDVFSLGIVLYELLTVRRLFKGENELLIMASLVLGHVPPPSNYRPDLPPELEDIVLKALANKPADRYQTAEKMRLALERFAARSGLRTSSTTLADYVKQQFGERCEPWLDDEPEVEIEVDFDGSASGIVQAPMDALAELAMTDGPPWITQVPIARARSRAATAAERTETPPDAPDAPDAAVGAQLPAAPRHRRWWLAGTAAIVAIASALVLVVPRHAASPHASVALPAAPGRVELRAPVPMPAAIPIPIAIPVAVAAEPVAPIAAKPVAKARVRAAPVAPTAKPATNVHWNPNALFPED